jgi:DNA-binding transcriptional ArsR family regulator
MKTKGRREGGRFVMLPEAVILSAEYQSLPGGAVRLLIALAAQYNGRNNGDLAAALSVVRRYGLASADTVSANLKRLEAAGLIVRTRDGQFCGGASTCALYALAWKPVDPCPGKGLTVAPTDRPIRTFYPAPITERPVRKP